MENILINPTNKTPYVNFDRQNGLMELTGSSIPESPIDELVTDAPKKIYCNIQLKYINSSSLKCLIGIFRKLINVKSNNENIEINVNWYYTKDDEDMYDTGKECEELTGFTFNMIEE